MPHKMPCVMPHQPKLKKKKKSVAHSLPRYGTMNLSLGVGGGGGEEKANYKMRP